MVGDDLWSDVQGAQRAGLEGWLVRTGKFREEALRDSGITPDRVLSSVAALARPDPDGGLSFRARSDWSEVAGPAGPAAARRAAFPVALSAQSATDSGPAPPSDPTVIRAIQLERRDVFDPHEKGWLARVANALHIETRAPTDPPGAALRRRASRTTPPGWPNRSAISARWASSAESRSTRCRPIRAS